MESGTCESHCFRIHLPSHTKNQRRIKNPTQNGGREMAKNSEKLAWQVPKLSQRQHIQIHKIYADRAVVHTHILGYFVNLYDS